ncbi:MAG: hypothetical protein AAGA11_04635 [Pseudomonadota bacterium]
MEHRWLLAGVMWVTAVGLSWAEPGSCLPGKGCRDEPNWLDRSHSALSDRTERLAVSLDRFFGLDDSAEEAARSFVRLRGSVGYDHLDGGDAKLSVKGQWHLPRTDERIGLVFSDGEEGDELDARTDTDRAVGLQFEQRRDRRLGRFGLRLTLRSRAKLRTELRYRISSLPAPNAVRLGGLASLWWQDGRGVGVTFGGTVEKSLNSRNLVRYSARVERAEDFEGVQWEQTVALSSQLSLRDASVAFLRFTGETEPVAFTRSVALGLLYRRQVFRQWMFMEIEPVFDWRRPDHDEPRELAPSIVLRIEWQLGDPPVLW